MNINHFFETADAVRASDSLWLDQIWEGARTKMNQHLDEDFLFVIDEIQKINNWSESIKNLWDEDSNAGRKLKVLILGSSRLLVQQGLTESLAGVLKVLIWGTGLILKCIMPSVGRRNNSFGSKVQGQLQGAGNTTTLSHYLSLLDTAGLLAGIEKFSADIIRKRSSSPKFQVHNNALISAQRNELFEEIQKKPGDWGRMVESAIGAHFINSTRIKVYYWRHRNEEVDFVLEKRGKLVALEIKTGGAYYTSGMKSFREQFKPDKILLIGKKGIPWQELLKMEPDDLF